MSSGTRSSSLSRALCYNCLLAPGRFKVGRAKAIMDAVLVEKLAFTNDRDKKGRLAWTYDAEECRELSQAILETKPSPSPSPSP